MEGYQINKILFLLISILILSFSACSKIHSTADNASPEALYQQDQSIDFLVYNDIAYVNAADLDWVADLKLTSSEKIGEIKRTNVTKKYKDLDATILEVGTEFYSVTGRDDFVLVSVNHELVPYYAYVEG